MSSFLSAVYRKERTWNNFRPDVMKSGLQKYIRRGNTDKALYCAGELDLMKETPAVEGGSRAECLRTNFLHRLMVIYIEDVGIANFALWPLLDEQIFAVFKERTKADRKKCLEETLLSNMVRQLCASEKSRSCSHVRAAVKMGDEISQRVLEAGTFPTIRDLWQTWRETSDENTRDFEGLCRGFRKALKRRCFTAVAWASRIASSEETVKEYRKRKAVWRVFRILEEELPETYKHLHAIAMRWYSELEGLKEAELCWMLLILAIIQEPELGVALTSTEGGTWDRNRGGEVLEVDAFIEDRHTAKGRGKSLTEFALVGAQVDRESTYVIQEFKRFYEEVKKAMDAEPPMPKKEKPAPKPAPPTPLNPPSAEPMEPMEPTNTTAPLESEAYTFLVRTQLTTSANKYDVYFGTEVETGQFVVIKGPYKSPREIQNMLEVQEWKKARGIPACEAKLVWLRPDRWPAGVPLGYRNKTDRTKPAPFLISPSVIPQEILVTKSHSSKIWPATEVVDWNKIPLHFDISRATPEQMKDYVLGLLVRHIFGIGDLADRNFLVIGDHVLSIDEETRGKEICFLSELRKQKYERVKKWIQEHERELDVGKLGLTWEACQAMFP